MAYICKNYNYTLFDIYQKRWKEGGPTVKQLYGLFHYGQEGEYLKIKMQAALQGVDIEAEKGTDSKPAQQTENAENGPFPLFKDPSEYNHLSDEERQEMTDRMMGKHRVWANKSTLNQVQKRGTEKDG